MCPPIFFKKKRNKKDWTPILYVRITNIKFEQALNVFAPKCGHVSNSMQLDRFISCKSTEETINIYWCIPNAIIIIIIVIFILYLVLQLKKGFVDKIERYNEVINRKGINIIIT